MKTGKIIFFAFMLILMFSGCKKEDIPPIYPNYSPEKEVSDVVMTAEQLSEHRYRLFIDNNSDAPPVCRLHLRPLHRGW